MQDWVRYCNISKGQFCMGFPYKIDCARNGVVHVMGRTAMPRRKTDVAFFIASKILLSLSDGLSMNTSISSYTTLLSTL